MQPQAPLSLHAGTVLPEWIDYNGHMNIACYTLAFDQATGALLDHLGLDDAYREASGCAVRVLEAHVTYERELLVGEPLRVTTRLVDRDESRLHHYHEMLHAEAGYLSATSEIVVLHVDPRGERPVPMPRPVRSRVDALVEAHRTLPRPSRLGRAISIGRGRPSGT